MIIDISNYFKLIYSDPGFLKNVNRVTLLVIMY